MKISLAIFGIIALIAAPHFIIAFWDWKGKKK